MNWPKIKLDKEDSDKAKNYIDKAVNAAQRGIGARPADTDFQQTGWNMKKGRSAFTPEIKEALKLLRSSIPVTIEIKQQLDSRSMVLADPIKIHQVVMKSLYQCIPLNAENRRCFNRLPDRSADF